MALIRSLVALFNGMLLIIISDRMRKKDSAPNIINRVLMALLIDDINVFGKLGFNNFCFILLFSNLFLTNNKMMKFGI